MFKVLSGLTFYENQLDYWYRSTDPYDLLNTVRRYFEPRAILHIIHEDDNEPECQTCIDILKNFPGEIKFPESNVMMTDNVLIWGPYKICFKNLDDLIFFKCRYGNAFK